MTADRATLKAAVLKVLEDTVPNELSGRFAAPYLHDGDMPYPEDVADAIVDAVMDAILAAHDDGGSVEWRDEWRVCAGPADDPAVFKDGIHNEEQLDVHRRRAHDRWSGEYIWVQRRRVGATDWEAAPDA